MVQPKLSAQTAAGLRKLILDRQLKPGDRFFSENSLADMFNVGRSTIREAVKILAAENVVEIHHGKGTFVCRKMGVTSDPLGLYFANQNRLLFNLLETRLIVEPHMALLAARRATGDDIHRLERIIRAYDEPSAEQESRFSSLDVDFHTTLADCTKNDVLHRFVPSICDAIWKGREETADNTASHERAIVSHRRIFEAIRDREPDNARKEMIAHIKQTAQDIAGEAFPELDLFDSRSENSGSKPAPG
ncbi:MAG: FadR family transcriptional regulator [Spirochaetaceae bacterium]|jgi:DNA-binding FadR family transcriptional regulator|nr:FadR family transcriptional regulator [Spirochaetaceae bacterium]